MDVHYCDKRFKTSSNLNKHVRTHNSEKPHECMNATNALQEKIR